MLLEKSAVKLCGSQVKFILSVNNLLHASEVHLKFQDSYNIRKTSRVSFSTANLYFRKFLTQKKIHLSTGLDAKYYSQRINTDAAEAILIGYYTVNDKLKWKISSREIFEDSNTSIGDLCIPNNSTNSNFIAETAGIVYASHEGKKVMKKRLFSIPLVERFSNGNVIPPPKLNEL